TRQAKEEMMVAKVVVHVYEYGGNPLTPFTKSDVENMVKEFHRADSKVHILVTRITITDQIK
ncbi:hypothetical protein PMAYCL1PPCAC_20905, partial [Pristionchus mayeri]